MLQRILSLAERQEMEKERREKLAKFARIFSGEDYSSSINDNGKNVAPVLPMNRYRFGFGSSSSRVKAGSRLPTPNNRIVLHPESMEKARKLAELYRLVKGE